MGECCIAKLGLELQDLQAGYADEYLP